jgi:hypothetical protein
LQEKFINHYNEKGNLVQRTRYDPASGNPILSSTYKYDNHGNVVETTWESSTSWGTRLGGGRETSAYTYNDKGLLVEARILNTDGALLEGHFYTLNDRGKVVEDIPYRATGAINKISTYQYDSLGNPVNSTERKADGHLLRKYAYTYNDRGNLMQTVAYDSNERISLTVTYSYDNAEHLVEKAQYSKDGSLITRTAYTHDANSPTMNSTRRSLCDFASHGDNGGQVAFQATAWTRSASATNASLPRTSSEVA